MSRSVAVASWEATDFPSVCENCLGDNPYLRMTKEHYGRDCKVCLKPFTIFRWCPGARMRFRRTEICSTCAKLKNLCQSCMLDLQFGLPAQVRDTVLGVTENVPKEEANREFFMATNRARLERGDTALVDYEKLAAEPKARTALERLSNKRPKYGRNLAAPCSFYAKGRCTRGDTCPYRHELVAERYPSLQSYRDRYYGENDPAAKEILDLNPSLLERFSKNESQARLVVTNTKGITEDQLKGYFETLGPLERVELNEQEGNASITFDSQVDPKDILSMIGDSFELHGHRLGLSIPPKDRPLKKRQQIDASIA